MFFGHVREVPFDRLAFTEWGKTRATDQKRVRRICGSSGPCAVLDELETIEHWTTTVMRTISAPGGSVDRKILDVAKVFLERLEGRYPVRGGVLFGSRARASHQADSDADLAVVLAGSSGDRRSASREMAGIPFDVLMETGVLVDPLPLWEDELERRVAFSNPALIDAIWRDGVRV